MKKIFSMLVAAAFMIGAFSACAKNVDTAQSGSSQAGTVVTEENTAKDRLKVVSTIFPVYDWVENILGEKSGDVDHTLLINSGIDLHSYQPTAEDIMKISEADVFIYVGGESDSWVQSALKEAANKDMVVLNLMEIMGDSAKAEETVEGMQDLEHDHDDVDHDHDAEDHDHEDADHDHDHEDTDHDHNHDHEDGEELDEHVWLSLENAKELVGVIAEALKTVDGENAGLYSANAKAYVEKLDELDEKYEDAVEAGSLNTILVADRFPFRYLVDDYDLKYYAAFVGCSAETEASFETITFLAKKVDELSLHTIFTIENSDKKIAETVVANTKSKDQTISELNSMQSVTSQDVANGASYLSIMEANLEALKEALK